MAGRGAAPPLVRFGRCMRYEISVEQWCGQYLAFFPLVGNTFSKTGIFADAECRFSDRQSSSWRASPDIALAYRSSSASDFVFKIGFIR